MGIIHRARRLYELKQSCQCDSKTGRAKIGRIGASGRGSVNSCIGGMMETIQKANGALSEEMTLVRAAKAGDMGAFEQLVSKPAV